MDIFFHLSLLNIGDLFYLKNSNNFNLKNSGNAVYNKNNS